MKRLGAYGSDLAAVQWFFEKPYEIPAEALDPDEQASVINLAAFALSAVGRLGEAIAAQGAALKASEGKKDWDSAAIRAANLSGLQLTYGDIRTALATAARANEYATKATNAVTLINNRTLHAHVLYASGGDDIARHLFTEIESWQREKWPSTQLLSSVRGYYYCDLLVAKREWHQARDRAAKTLEDGQAWYSLQSIALDELTIARTEVALALSNRHIHFVERKYVDTALERLRASGFLDEVPRGLLARTVFFRSVGDWQNALRDLDEVEEIAEPGPMRLHLCDMALERARLAFAQIEAFAPLNGMLETDNPPKPELPSKEEIAKLREEAEKQIKIADDYIQACGYHRRDEELAELKEVLAGKKTFAELPPRV